VRQSKENMPPITKQETFDIVFKHLKQQGCKSLNGGRCLYRGPNGLKCAAGVLIPDDKYHEGLEWATIDFGTRAGELLRDLGHNIPLVRDLQLCHDGLNVEDWGLRLEEIAKKHGLIIRQEDV